MGKLGPSFWMSLLACVLLVAVLFKADWQPAVGQSAVTTTGIAFDWSGVDINGQVESIDTGEVGLFIVAGASPALAPTLVGSVVVGANSVDVGQMISTVVDGQFDIRARVRDDAGNWSAWSAPATVTVSGHQLVLPAAPDTTPPAAPLNVRVVTIQVAPDGTVSMVATP